MNEEEKRKKEETAPASQTMPKPEDAAGKAALNPGPEATIPTTPPATTPAPKPTIVSTGPRATRSEVGFGYGLVTEREIIASGEPDRLIDQHAMAMYSYGLSVMPRVLIPNPSVLRAFRATAMIVQPAVEDLFSALEQEKGIDVPPTVAALLTLIREHMTPSVQADCIALLPVMTGFSPEGTPVGPKYYTRGERSANIAKGLSLSDAISQAGGALEGKLLEESVDWAAYKTSCVVENPIYTAYLRRITNIVVGKYMENAGIVDLEKRRRRRLDLELGICALDEMLAKEEFGYAINNTYLNITLPLLSYYLSANRQPGGNSIRAKFDIMNQVRDRLFPSQVSLELMTRAIKGNVGWWKKGYTFGLNATTARTLHDYHAYCRALEMVSSLMIPRFRNWPLGNYYTTGSQTGYWGLSFRLEGLPVYYDRRWPEVAGSQPIEINKLGAGSIETGKDTFKAEEAMALTDEERAEDKGVRNKGYVPGADERRSKLMQVGLGLYDFDLFYPQMVAAGTHVGKRYITCPSAEAGRVMDVYYHELGGQPTQELFETVSDDAYANALLDIANRCVTRDLRLMDLSGLGFKGTPRPLAIPLAAGGMTPLKQIMPDIEASVSVAGFTKSLGQLVLTDRRIAKYQLDIKIATDATPVTVPERIW